MIYQLVGILEDKIQKGFHYWVYTMKKLLSKDRKGGHNLLSYHSCPLTPPPFLVFFAYDNQRESHEVRSPCRQKGRMGKRKTNNKTNLKEIVPYTAWVETMNKVHSEKKSEKKHTLLRKKMWKFLSKRTSEKLSYKNWLKELRMIGPIG